MVPLLLEDSKFARIQPKNHHGSSSTDKTLIATLSPCARPSVFHRSPFGNQPFREKRRLLHRPSAAFVRAFQASEILGLYAARVK
jgi:hypothetical protein